MAARGDDAAVMDVATKLGDRIAGVMRGDMHGARQDVDDLRRMVQGLSNELAATNARVAVLEGENQALRAENQGFCQQLQVIQANGWVTTDRIQDNAVTTDKLHDNAVTTDQLRDDCVTAAKLGTQAVTARAVADHSVTAQQLAANAVPAPQAQFQLTAAAVSANLPADVVRVGDPIHIASLCTYTHRPAGFTGAKSYLDVCNPSSMGGMYSVHTHPSADRDPTWKSGQWTIERSC